MFPIPEKVQAEDPWWRQSGMSSPDLISLGHDSEFALVDGNQRVSALDVLGKKVLTSPAGRVFADNMNVEIAIEPCTTVQEWHEKTEELLDVARQGTFELDPGPVVEYPDAAYQHDLAWVGGCNPDATLYTHTPNQPDIKSMGKLRTTGGHVHIGFADYVNRLNFSTHSAMDGIAFRLDCFLALPFLKLEGENERRKYYGMAGSYRAKPYGLEYRTLASHWVLDEHLREVVFNRARWAVVEETWPGRSGRASLPFRQRAIPNWWDVPYAIDNYDLDLAETMMDIAWLSNIGPGEDYERI